MQFFPPRGIKELAVCIAHTTCPYLTLCASPLPSFGRDYCDVLIYKLLFPDLQLWCQFTIGNSTTLVAKVVLYEMFLQRWRLLTWARAWQMSQRLLSVMSGKVELLFLMLLRSWFLQTKYLALPVGRAQDSYSFCKDLCWRFKFSISEATILKVLTVELSTAAFGRSSGVLQVSC